MDKSLRNRLFVVLGVVVAAIYFAFPLEKRINLGLDLKGGMHLVMKVETEKLDANAKGDAVLRAIEILRNRIDSMGVAETTIQRQGETGILVQLPGVTDRDKALALIGKVAQLEFRLVSDDPLKLKEALEGKTPEGYELKYVKKENAEPILVEDKASLKGETIADGRVDFDSSGFGQPYISLTFNAEGAKIFGDLTKKNVNRRLAIIIDDEVLSAPNINEPILGGKGQITGNFSYDEASSLALALRSGALPAPMRIEEERTVGPLLGRDSINAGITATIIGAGLVFLFMIVYYLTAGVIADIALLLNILLILGFMGFFSVMMPEAKLTLTLPGIAGIILTLGMAVDANVLINERIREELRNGRTLRAAVSNGYSKAFTAIFDSNLTTLIAAFMLFQFGSGPIKGFAVTLSIGLIASVFTAVYVTRALFELLFYLKKIEKLPMAEIFQQTKIDFISKRYFCYAISGILIIASLWTWFAKKEAAYGIDFAGGQVQEYHFAQAVKVDDIRSALKNAGVNDAVIQQFKESPETILIKTGEDTYDKVSGSFQTSFPDNKFEIMRIEQVGPVVGHLLRQRAILAVIFALAGILIFVGFRFKHFDFAAAGVMALFHDVIITLGVVLMMGRQIDLLMITALLTIAGYSINDTIVIYDRVRENMGMAGKRMSLREVINLSVNQTLSRTILTTASTLLVILALYFKGGEVLNTFALCLMVGFVCGTYSTVFVASPLVLLWERKPGMKKK